MKLRDLQTAYANYQSKTGQAPRFPRAHVPNDNLRPARLAEFIGQRHVTDQLEVATLAALDRSEPLGHTLLTGPGGLGKTTIGLMIATEMGAPFIATTAPTLGQEPLTRMLSGLDRGTVLFVDEIHRMSKRTEELLYGAMEDGWIDCNTPIGFERRKVEPFTLVGATTLPGRMSESFKDRFDLSLRLEFYDIDSLTKIALRSAGVLGIQMSAEVAEEVAVRSRGVPRVANMLTRRLRDYASIKGASTLTRELAEGTFRLNDIDEIGLTKLDRELLTTLVHRFNCGPVGLENLAVAVGEDTNTVADDAEPYLVRLGLMARTPKGRIATEHGKQHVTDILASAQNGG